MSSRAGGEGGTLAEEALWAGVAPLLGTGGPAWAAARSAEDWSCSELRVPLDPEYQNPAATAPTATRTVVPISTRERGLKERAPDPLMA